MPLISKSKNSIWTGPWKVGPKKKEVGFVVAMNIRTDKLPGSIKPQELKDYLICEVEKMIKTKVGM